VAKTFFIIKEFIEILGSFAVDPDKKPVTMGLRVARFDKV
jgi:hypothetical protein